MIKAMGGWLLLDGVGSIVMYYGKKGYDGETQSWRKDHSLRVARSIIGLLLIIWG
tara:strand:+ start:1904 stop:2068 length:165 start_codon:yes stop_codon:yes gene_type:complete